jgi:hypothetical protein
METNVPINQAKPVKSDPAANELFCEGLIFLKIKQTAWNITQISAICQRLLSTAQPRACRKLD